MVGAAGAIGAVGAVAATSALTGGNDLTTTPADAPVAAPPTTTTTQPALPGWSLLWSDEFDGKELDTDVWLPYHSTYGDGNDELQCHTPDNVEVSGGRLMITARREPVRCPNGSLRQFSSGFVGTRETGTYFPRFARYEIRAKLPHGQGLWPAFWLRHRDGAKRAEIDVMEYFHAQHPGLTTATLHVDGKVETRRHLVFEEPTDDPQWHTWTVEIERLDLGVQLSFARSSDDGDSRVSYRFVDREAAWAQDHRGEDLFDIALNLSVGGRWAGDPDGPLGYLSARDECAQGGVPPHCEAEGVRPATFPSTYEIDYVRVYVQP